MINDILKNSFEELEEDYVCENDCDTTDITLEVLDSEYLSEVNSSKEAAEQLIYAVESLKLIYSNYGNMDDVSLNVALESVFSYLPSLKKVISLEEIKKDNSSAGRYTYTEFLKDYSKIVSKIRASSYQPHVKKEILVRMYNLLRRKKNEATETEIEENYNHLKELADSGKLFGHESMSKYTFKDGKYTPTRTVKEQNEHLDKVFSGNLDEANKISDNAKEAVNELKKSFNGLPSSKFNKVVEDYYNSSSYNKTDSKESVKSELTRRLQIAQKGTDAENGNVPKKGSLRRLAGATLEAIKRFISNVINRITGYAKTEEKRKSIVKQLKENTSKLSDDPKNKSVSIYKTVEKCFYYNGSFSVEHIKDWMSFLNAPLDGKKVLEEVDKLTNLKKSGINKDYFTEIKTFSKVEIYEVISLIEKLDEYINKRQEECKKVYAEIDKQFKTDGDLKKATELEKQINLINQVVEISIARFIPFVRLAQLMLKQY